MLRKTIAGALIGATMTIGAFVSTSAIANAAEVYMIRGAFNVFSAGMDQMTRKIKARGIKARGMSNGEWSGVAADIIRRHKQGKVSFPIIIAGHSVGGQEAPRMSDMLWKAGVPVKLVIGVDPGFAPPPPFTVGKTRVVNFWIKGAARGNPYRKAASFGGTVQNINIATFTNADHVQIDKDPQVQSKILSLIYGAI